MLKNSKDKNCSWWLIRCHVSATRWSHFQSTSMLQYLRFITYFLAFHFIYSHPAAWNWKCWFCCSDIFDAMFPMHRHSGELIIQQGRHLCFDANLSNYEVLQCTVNDGYTVLRDTVLWQRGIFSMFLICILLLLLLLNVKRSLLYYYYTVKLVLRYSSYFAMTFSFCLSFV